MSTEAPVAPRADACPEPELLAAYVDGALAPDERGLVERHLVTCADCRDIVAGSVAAVNELSEVTRAPRSRSRRPLWTIGGLVAAAAAVVLAVQLRDAMIGGDMRALVAAAGDERSIEPRLSGDFKYAPLSVRRGPRDAGTPADLQLAAARIREHLASDRSAARLHADGVARLMLGDAGGAVAALSEAAERDPSPGLSADLAAALIVRGTREDRAADFTTALDLLARIPSEPAPPAAIFNKALALEKLNLREQAREAWREYLARDPRSGWAEEARRHLDDLSK